MEKIKFKLLGLTGFSDGNFVIFEYNKGRLSYSYVELLTLRVRLAPLNWFKLSSKIFYWPFKGGTSFVDLLCFFCLVFAISLCVSVYMCFVVTCWERADLLALFFGV